MTGPARAVVGWMSTKKAGPSFCGSAQETLIVPEASAVERLEENDALSEALGPAAGPSKTGSDRPAKTPSLAKSSAGISEQVIAIALDIKHL